MKSDDIRHRDIKRVLRGAPVRRAAASAIPDLLERRTLFSPVIAAYDLTPGATDNTPTNLAADLATAINTANASTFPNTIELDPGQTYDFTAANNYWYGPNALPAISSTITIEGNGAVLQRDSSLAQTTAGAFRFFYVSGGLSGLSAGNLTLRDLTLTNGLAKGGDSGGGGGGMGAGGAIFNQGTLSLNGVTLAGNNAKGGATDLQTAAFGLGGGGMGQDGGESGGGFGGAFSGASGGSGYSPTVSQQEVGGPGGGGGGFTASATGQAGGGSSGLGSGSGDGGNGGHTFDAVEDTDGAGGNFGSGGVFGGSEGGGGGVGGGGGGAADDQGGGGGFGGGGGNDNNGGFGGGAGNYKNGVAAVGGFGGGNNSSHTGSGGGGAGLGGAIFSMYGSVSVVNSTLTANAAIGGASTDQYIGGGYGGSGFGGAIFDLDGSVNLSFATIAVNTVTAGAGNAGNGSADGGSVYLLAYGKTPTGTAVNASATIDDSILANSTGSTHELVNNTDATHASGKASIDMSGPNIIRSQSNSGTGSITGTTPITADPQLASLASNGGLSQTMALLNGSPAINVGGNSAAGSLMFDQRGSGYPRIVGGTVDVGAYESPVVAYPTPLLAQDPAGSLIYDPSVTGSIGSAGATSAYTLPLAAGQTLTLVMTPGAGLQGTVAIVDPVGNTIATATGSAPGATVVLESAAVTTAGNYTLIAGGASSTTGTFTLQAILNAVYKPAGQTINTIGTSLDLSSAFTSLGTTPSADRAGVVGILSSSPDYYAFPLTAGESASIAVKGSGGTAAIALYDGSGNLLALPTTGTGVDGIISQFVAPTTSTYYVQVTGAASMTYDLVVTRGADFDIHGTSFASAQQLNATDVALGSLPTGGGDFYSFNDNAGDNLVIATTTPGGGSSSSGPQFVNNFQPTLNLFDANGNLVATATGNAADGRDDVIDWTGLVSGSYRVEVVGATDTNTGEYTLAIQGATGGESPLTVASTSPAANADLPTQVSSMTVSFSSSILATSLSDSDFTIDGMPATGFTLTDSQDASFSFPTTSNGLHNVSISGVVGTDGVALTPDNFSFNTDDVAPTVVSSSISNNAVLSPGSLTEVVTFSKPLDTASVAAADIALQGTIRKVSYAPASFSFDPTGTILTINYSSLPTDSYALTLVASASSYTSVAGVPLASSYVVDFTIPPLPAVPTISTTALPSSAVVGSSIADKATITGGNHPTGTVTFNLYTNAACVGGPLFTDTEKLSGGTATSKGYTTTATGTDYWFATYNGDANNGPVESSAAGEPVVISATRLKTVIHTADDGGVYDGKPFPATGYVADAGSGMSIAKPVITYYLASDAKYLHPLAGAPTDAGHYLFKASFAGDSSYLPSVTTAPFTIAKAKSVIHAADLGGVANGKPHPATGYVAGVGGVHIATPVITYYFTSDTKRQHPLAGAPSAAGSYTFEATFAGNTNYLPSISTAPFKITKTI